MGQNKETKKAPQVAESLPQGRSQKKKTSRSNAVVIVFLTDINQLKESGKQRHLFCWLGLAQGLASSEAT